MISTLYYNPVKVPSYNRGTYKAILEGKSKGPFWFQGGHKLRSGQPCGILPILNLVEEKSDVSEPPLFRDVS